MSGSVLITGSHGLVGSACVRRFQALGWEVYGLDGGQRRVYFGDDGDTSVASRQLPDFENYPFDIRRSAIVERLVKRCQPDLIIHCAAQPSHDYATAHPVIDFEVNAVGTLNLLEAARRHAHDATFIFMSTNKVYGDAVNELPVNELPTRYEYGYIRSTACDRYGDTVELPDEGADPEKGINERMRLDNSRHSIFGASKAAADLLVQEYGRTYGMKTCCFRAGCLTGGDHAGAELHGFLAYLAKCVKEGRPYRVYGYKGKQVRDQLHADDVALACEAFANDPKVAEVYNLGGGFDNSISILEAIEWMEEYTGKRLEWSYVDEPRGGDHICYYTDTTKFRSDYPGWSVTRDLESILEELCAEKVLA